jgi:DNA-binding NtrC family response regulator
MDALRHNSHVIPVVICNHTLPDGDWTQILAAADGIAIRPSLVASSRMADERLWAEVLNLGAFDLLLGGPFDREEVLRVVENAWWASDGYAKYALPLNRRHPERALGRNSRKLVGSGGS